MKNSHRLALYEEILLLDLDDDKGTVLTGLHRNAMAGAILAELVILAAITLKDDKHKTVQVNAKAQTNDPILDEALQLMSSAKKPRPAMHWVMKIANMKNLYHRVAQQLVAKGVLAEKTGTVLMLFKRTIYPEVDSSPERELIRRLEKAIFTSTRQVDERTLVIIALANATRSLYKVFDKKRLKSRKARIEQITSGQLVGQATKEAVAAIQAAIMVATIVPVVTSAH
jgi:hypothetical protein